MQRIILSAIFISCSTILMGQDLLQKRIDLHIFEERFSVVLGLITEQSDIYFSYNSELFPANQKFTLKAERMPVGDVLNMLLVGTGIEYALFKNQVVFNLPVNPNIDGFSVTGNLIDSTSNERIHGAHVYLDGTEYGDYTTIEGRFEFGKVPSGTYELVISHVTYGVKNYYLYVNDKIEDLNIYLLPKVNLLEELEVVSSKGGNWDLYYNLFVEEFIGQSMNAEKCKILNEDAIRIVFDSTDRFKEFEVVTTEPLRIQNEALGYNLLYDLIFFKSEAGLISYVGKTNFEVVQPTDRRTRKRWKRKRIQAYRGSLRHFLQADIDGKVKENRFKTRYVDDVPESVEFKYYPANLKSKEMIHLKNISEEIPEGKFLKVTFANDEISYVARMDDELNQKYKNFKDLFDLSSGILVYGVWSKQRLSDALPLSFYLSIEE